MSWTIDSAERAVGRLSEPSKMPCYGYSLPAPGMNRGFGECRTGSKLMKVKGSVCSICYARKGRFVMPRTQVAMARRATAIHSEHWVSAMSYIMAHKRQGGRLITHFRWHDSGDLQGLWHLRKIAQVALAVPRVQHWLPTQERGIVLEYFEEYGPLPENLVVRLSATRIGKRVPGPLGVAFTTSGVDVQDAWQCPAPSQNNECGECRVCWNPAVPIVSYSAH